jgi:hypothetical protein
MKKNKNIFFHEKKKHTGNVIIDKFGGSHNLYYKDIKAKRLTIIKEKEKQGFVVKNIWELMFGETEPYRHKL